MRINRECHQRKYAEAMYVDVMESAQADWSHAGTSKAACQARRRGESLGDSHGRFYSASAATPPQACNEGQKQQISRMAVGFKRPMRVGHKSPLPHWEMISPQLGRELSLRQEATGALCSILLLGWFAYRPLYGNRTAPDQNICPYSELLFSQDSG